MNCGIVTFHKAHNYGAVLQAYALQKTLSNFGYSVSFVDYQHQEIEKIYRLFPVFNENGLIVYSKRWIHTILDFKRKYNRYHAFSEFINENFNCVSLDNKCTYDCVVLGSDQIWNPEYTNGFVKVHFGKDSNLEYSKLISYAASMGKENLTDDELSEFKENIENIDIIGVREESLKLLINNILPKRDVRVNLDPTLLLPKSDWDELSDNEVPSEPYILVYEVKFNSLTPKIVEFIKNKYNINVIVLSARTNFKLPKTYITDASPKKFLSLFKHAKFVVTTSFHGTVFSIINNKPFITVGFGDHTDSRSRSLLNQLSLIDRMAFEESDIHNMKLDIDYEIANKKLVEMQMDSISYLKENLKGEL